MKFWDIKVFDDIKKKDVSFILKGPSSYKKNKIKKILLSVHPEYSKFTITPIDPPPGAHIWGE